MPPVAPIVVPCPRELRTEALALVLGELAPSQRREIGAQSLRDWKANDTSAAALLVAMRGEQLCGAAWGQFQPGNTAVFWPPRLDSVEEAAPVAAMLASAVVKILDEHKIAMTQVLLPAPDAPEAPLLESVGFRYLTDLVYLTCERERFASEPLPFNDFDLVPFDERDRERLGKIVERTYENTLDCVGLGLERSMDDVIDGYFATGAFRAENWFFVRAKSPVENDADIGVLLLADHPASEHMELIYIGLVPTARGRGWGRQIARFAQSVAFGQNSQRLVSAVDATNLPGLNMYRATHFEIWDRRSVFLRFLSK